MRKGLSLIEIMTVVVIIGILSALALPNFANIIERNRIRNAECNLKAIYQAEKRYRLNNENGSFYVYNGTETDATKAINQNLSLKIDEPHFTYTIDGSGSDYRAIATRVSGPCAHKNISIQSDNSTLKKEECGAWNF